MLRIKDSRSFFGALAFLVVGLLISLANLFYFYIDYFGKDVFMSRWWWELTLNLQILCFASIWYAYHERLTTDTDRRTKMRSYVYFVGGMIAVSVPIVLMSLGIFTDWFRQLAVRDNVITVHHFVISLWFVSAVILVLTRRRSQLNQYAERILGWKKALAFVVKNWAGVLMVFLVLLGEVVRADFIYVLTPLLGYLQIALPGLRRSFKEARYEAQ